MSGFWPSSVSVTASSAASRLITAGPMPRASTSPKQDCRPVPRSRCSRWWPRSNRASASVPGGQLTPRRQRNQDHERRGRGLRYLQHRRGAQAVTEHRLLPADAELKNGPADVAKAAHDAGIAESFPVDHTLSEDGKGGPPNNGIVLGQCQTRVLDMASAYATITASGVYHAPHFVQKVVNTDGQVLFDASTKDNSGEQRIDKAVADNVTSAMQPIAGWSNGHNLAGGRARRPRRAPISSATPTTTATPGWSASRRLCRRRCGWADRRHPAVKKKSGSPVYGSGLPSDIWKNTMDGALKGTDNESFPKPTEIGGYAGVPAPPPPPSTPARHRSRWCRDRPSRSRRASPSRSVRRRRCPALRRVSRGAGSVGAPLRPVATSSAGSGSATALATPVIESGDAEGEIGAAASSAGWCRRSR